VAEHTHLSDGQIRQRISKRKAKGKPVGRLLSALWNRLTGK
jgi:hypothetical protein